MSLTHEQVELVGLECGRHGNPPEGERERQLWGLIEILDFQCDEYGDAPEGVKGGAIREYLKEHRNEIAALTCEPPSFLGLVAGILNFLETD